MMIQTNSRMGCNSRRLVKEHFLDFLLQAPNTFNCVGLGRNDSKEEHRDATRTLKRPTTMKSGKRSFVRRAQIGIARAVPG